MPSVGSIRASPRFYERRICRIFPALFAVLAVCIVLAGMIFLPKQLRGFDESLLAATFFVSNIYFYSDTGYFAARPDTLPLLHTWSLSIEEQFYIVFPLLLSLAIAFSRRVWVGLIAVLFVLSLAASIWVTPINPAAAFYLAPMRVWELMLGALLAARILPRIESQAVREMLALAGVALIAYAVFRFSTATPFPGSAALIPCLGAALLIYAGEDEGTSLAAKFLSLWPVVFIGLISYSLYLWHWPLLVFARYWNVTPLSGWQSVAIVIASFILAALSWRYIEQPFRRKRAAIPRRIFIASAATAMGLAVAFGLTTVSAGWPTRFSPQVLAIGNDIVMPDSRRSKFKSCREQPPERPCLLGAAVKPNYAIWGDSHAGTMLPTLDNFAGHHGIALQAFVQPGCPPLVDIDFRSPGTPEGCMARNAKTLAALESAQDVSTVILMSRAAGYIKGALEGEQPRMRSTMFGPNGEELDLKARTAVWERQFDVTVDRLLAAGKTVVLVYPVPEIGYSVPSALRRVLATGRDPASLNPPLAAFQERQDI
ncbi:MAG: acyltransferase family protein, partial [Methyloceanibacter sp.]